jgi:hypothetical protein
MVASCLPADAVDNVLTRNNQGPLLFREQSA